MATFDFGVPQAVGIIRLWQTHAAEKPSLSESQYDAASIISGSLDTSFLIGLILWSN
jgi:hypothetical protein